MATLKSVYFSDSDPEVWFESRQEAEKFDKKAEIVSYLNRSEDITFPRAQVAEIVGCLQKRYEITERYDYNQPFHAKTEPDEAA